MHKSWRIQLKLALAKRFGLFGYDRELYKELSAAHKIVSTVENQGEVALSPRYCAHADSVLFGAAEKPSLSQQHPTLKVRSKMATSQRIKLPKIVGNEIPFECELGEQTLKFITEHQPFAEPSENANDKYFAKFFKPSEERSTIEKFVSDSIQTIMNLVP